MVQARRIVARKNRRHKVLQGLRACLQQKQTVDFLTVAVAKGRRLLSKLSDEDSAGRVEAALLPGLLHQAEARLRSERDMHRRSPVRIRPTSAKVVSSAWQGIEAKGESAQEPGFRSIQGFVERSRPKETPTGRWTRPPTMPVVHSTLSSKHASG